MPFQFAHQPFATGYSLRDFFDEVRTSNVSEFDIVSAWVKQTGTTQVSPALMQLRKNNVRLRAVVGISLGGTSLQGLEELLVLVDELYIYQHHGRTFHPKIYRGSNKESAITMVGSSNLTAGGVANNFEAGTVGRLSLTEADEATYHSHLKSYIDQIVHDSASRLVDRDLIAELVSNDRYTLVDESAQIATGDESGTSRSPTDQPIFKKSRYQLDLFLPPRATVSLGDVVSTRNRSIDDVAQDPVVDMPVVETEALLPMTDVVRRWFKVLGAIDAQQGASANWNPSNTATLVQAGHSIDRGTYFREEMFVDLDWKSGESRGGKERETAELRVRVFTDDGYLGEHVLELRHTPDYDSDQSNRTTELQWGTLGSHMREVNHVGQYLTIELLSDGSFQLHLTTQLPGAFRK